MHKFFCNYNSLTERYELGITRNMMFNNKINVLAENTLLPEIKALLQELYENTLALKGLLTDEKQLKILDESELLMSNLYYSLFASPLELVEGSSEAKTLLARNVEIASELEAKINIPEYSRSAMIIKNNFQNIINHIGVETKR